MTRSEIITALRPFFDVKELVCDHTYNKWGEQSWNFLGTDYLHCLLILRRDIIKRPMWCNVSQKHQKGLRCNRCDLVKGKNVVYLSAHVLGIAGDFTISGMNAETARTLVKQNADKFPCPVRIEKGVNWLHFDTRPTIGDPRKVIEFTA